MSGVEEVEIMTISLLIRMKRIHKYETGKTEENRQKSMIIIGG